MTRLGVVLIIAALACSGLSACSGTSQRATGARSVEPVIAQGSGSSSEGATTQDPFDLPAVAVASGTSSVGQIATKACPCIAADHLDRVVALAIDGLADTTSRDGWSRACARVFAHDPSVEPYTVSVKIGWQGTLHEYESIPGASAIVGLADEAYELEGGDRIALRSGELVAVVTVSGTTQSGTEAWARQVAEQLSQ